jgi:hypothetical protein
LMAVGLPYVRVGAHRRFNPATVDHWLRTLRHGETVLPPGDYRCLRCGWLGTVPQSVRLQDLGPCPQCGTKGRVARI